MVNWVFPIFNLKIHVIQLIRWQKISKIKKTSVSFSLQDIIIERMLGEKHSVQDSLLLKLLFVGLKDNVSIYALKGQYCKE